jgi:cardiolipin synthase A/B
VEMLVDARRRGVSVEIVAPGAITDAGLVRRASRAKWGPLLEAGVKIYEYQPTMYHNKLIVVDDYWVSVGSTNLDNRSFRLNDEANLNVFDQGFGRAQAEIFAQDRARSRQVTLEEWRGRPVTERIEEMVAWALRRQL